MKIEHSLRYLNILCKRAEALCKQRDVYFDKLHEDYIVVPHRSPPFVLNAREAPPVEDDGDVDVAGDHDVHRCVPLLDGGDYQGHQELAVHSLCENHLRNILLGNYWRLEAIVQNYRLSHYLNEEFNAVSEHECWQHCWPVIDEDGCLTGAITDGSDDYLTTDDNMAAISKADAVRAGAVIDSEGGLAVLPVELTMKRG